MEPLGDRARARTGGRDGANDCARNGLRGGFPHRRVPFCLFRPNGTPGASPGLPSGRGNATAEILVFTSLSVPAASWRQWAHDAARGDAALVLRGVGEGGLPGTAKRIADRLGGAEAGVAIDPRLFRLFGVNRVPAVVVVPGGVPPCRSRGCAADPAPPHDRITGNVGLVAALRAVADEGTVAREVARRHLERMEDQQ